MMPKRKDENMATKTQTQWAVVSTYGSRIKVLGESIEWCDLPLDDFSAELDDIEKCVRKVREQIAFIRGRPMPGLPTWKLNREMYREAVKDCLARDLDPSDLPRELELELFGSEHERED